MTQEQEERIRKVIERRIYNTYGLVDQIMDSIRSIINESPSFNPCLWPDWKVNEAEAIFEELLKKYDMRIPLTLAMINRIENLLKPLPTKPLTELEKAEAWLKKYMDDHIMENPQMLEEAPKILLAYKAAHNE